MTLFNPNSLLTSSMGLPGTYGWTRKIVFLASCRITEHTFLNF